MGTGIAEEPAASEMPVQSRLLDLNLTNMAESSGAVIAVALWEGGREGEQTIVTHPKILISVDWTGFTAHSTWSESVDSTHLPNIWHVSIRN
jgi:hypothetical protein